MQGQQLLTESQVFEDEVFPRTKSPDNPSEDIPERHDHGKNLIGTVGIEIFAKSLILRVYDLLARHRLDVNRQQVIDDRRSGLSLTQVAKKHSISRASVCRLMKEAPSNPDAPVPALAGNMPEQASAAGAAQ